MDIVTDTDDRIVLKNDLSGRVLSVMAFMVCAGLASLFVLLWAKAGPSSGAVVLFPLFTLGAFYALFRGFLVKEIVFDHPSGQIIVRAGTKPFVWSHSFQKGEIVSVYVEETPAQIFFTGGLTQVSASPARWTVSLSLHGRVVRVYGDIVQSNAVCVANRIQDFIQTLISIAVRSLFMSREERPTPSRHLPGRECDRVAPLLPRDQFRSLGAHRLLPPHLRGAALLLRARPSVSRAHVCEHTWLRCLALRRLASTRTAIRLPEDGSEDRMNAATKIAMCWSGGKDSAMALAELRRCENTEVFCLLTTVTAAYERISIHGVHREFLHEQAAALGLGVRELRLSTSPSNETYERAFRRALAELRSLGVSSVAFGDLFLEDIRRYREKLLEGTGIEPRFPIWGRPTRGFAEEFIARGSKAYVVCVDTRQLSECFAGRLFDEKFLDELPETVDPCGERGEFHTFVFDGPEFSRSVPVKPSRIHWGDGGRFCFRELVRI